MVLVVADTSPIRYLVQIGHCEILAILFQDIAIPATVADELCHPSAPLAVRAWMERKPNWLAIWPVIDVDDSALNTLDPGEKSAIALGLRLKADLIVIDDRKGAAVAAKKGFAVIGTLGILDLAARRGMIDLREALGRLKRTNFRYPQRILAKMLDSENRE